MIASSAGLDRDLRSVLETALAARGHKAPIATFVRRRSLYSSSFALDSLDVTLEDGCALALVFKNVGRSGLLQDALHAKPEFLRSQVREIEIYRRVLDPERHRTPVCYVAMADEPGDRYWLVLERVEADRLAEVGQFTAWECAARWLRRFHDEFAGDAHPVPGLLTYDRGYYERWLERALDVSSRTSAVHHATVRRLAERYEDVLGCLAALPSSLIHGEFYPLNVLLKPEPGGYRVCPIDWETAAIGPGLMDVAALTTGWPDADRRRLAAAYYGSGATGFASLADMQRRLDYCRVHQAIQWLGWSVDWTPPAEQVHDWMNTASELTEQLSL